MIKEREKRIGGGTGVIESKSPGDGTASLFQITRIGGEESFVSSFTHLPPPPSPPLAILLCHNMRSIRDKNSVSEQERHR